MIIYRASKNMIRQNVTIVEWKHHAGAVFDEDGLIGLEKELEIFERVQSQIRQMFPLFTMKIILGFLKVLGKDHLQQ